MLIMTKLAQVLAYAGADSAQTTTCVGASCLLALTK